jgi:hypothetical protein
MAPAWGWLFAFAEHVFPSLVDAQLIGMLHDL